MANTHNTHVLLNPETVLALDFFAMVKTDVGPARWSRAACIREAVDLYLDRFRVSGDAGAYEIIDTVRRRRTVTDMYMVEFSKVGELFGLDPHNPDEWLAVLRDIKDAMLGGSSDEGAARLSKAGLDAYSQAGEARNTEEV